MLSTESAASFASDKKPQPGLNRVKPVPVSKVKGGRATKSDQAGKNALKKAPVVAWPKPGKATAELVTPTDSSRKPAPRKLRAGTLPLAVTPAPANSARKPGALSKVTVETLDRSAAKKAGVEGVLLKVGAGDQLASGSAVDIELDYSGFQFAYGGDWASRLTLVQLPSCALTDPDKASCKTGKPLQDVRNDVKDGKLKAKVALPVTGTGVTGARQKRSAMAAPMLLAATAGLSGASGDFKATSLSPSGVWEAGGSSGGFSWSYPMNVPAVPGGLQPQLNLGYSSQSVDGRTAATNNQANWVGDGWSLADNFIERKYKSCLDDMKDGNNKAKNGDLCWGPDNATISLNGKANELVKDDKTGTWKLKRDDGTKIVRLTDTARGNGDNDGEYWRVTTPDGTQYYFGYNRLPGWSSGKTETNSTWNVPVYGNHKGEPCYKDSFADSYCNQAWRWNLDYVVDPNDNAMAFYYAAETNRYARNVSLTTGKGTPTEYARGGYLKRIEYGLRADNVYGSNAAAAKVNFTEAERCLVSSDFNCAEDKFTKDNAKQWPDVPFDQYCKPGDKECKDQFSPTFWTRKRLQKASTEILTGGKYQPVDSWELEHQFPSTGDGSAPALWLASLTRTGHTAGKTESLPPITFSGVQMANRVEQGTDPIPPLVRYRVYGIDTESGGTIGITYSKPECKAGDLPNESSNSRRCYPVYWSSKDSPGADNKEIKDWFHTYVVTQILENDNTGGAPAKQTDYEYLGGTAWAKSQDELDKPEHRTNSVFRGYERVRTHTGTGDDKRTLTEHRFFRGMAGSQVADGEGNKVDDHESFAGMPREQATYEGDGGKLLSAVAYEPWRKGPTASRARPGLPSLESHVLGMKAENARTAVGDGWRRTKAERTFDDYGMVATESDLGDTAKSGDETCTVTTYARNPKNNILNAVASQKKLATVCGSTPDLPGDLISEKRSYYDDSTAFGELPEKGAGRVTRTDENDGKGTGFITTETSAYDAYGRQVTSVDALRNKTTTAFTPAAGEAPAKTVVTNALGHTTTTELDARRGQATAIVDANGKRTDSEYDAFGRLAKVWQPGRDKGTYPDSPNIAHAYVYSKTSPVAVKTTVLHGDGTFATSYTLLDGLLRVRQSQAPASSGKGRVITESHYDSRGLVRKAYGGYYADGDPSATLVKADDTKVPNITETVYDGAGRATASIGRKYGDETLRSTTTYEGDRTTVVPPKGGTATTTVSDALGRTSELIQYTNADRTTSQSTHYAYDKHGRLAKVTDPEGTEWKYGYDFRGRKIRVDDPDKGASALAYDDLDRPVTATDENKRTLTTGYDALGRKTAVKQGDTLLSEWTYDSVAKGWPTAAKRYISGKPYVTETTAYDDSYNPKASQVTVPDTEGALAGTYRWSYLHNAKSGLLESTTQPALGGLPAERVTTRHTSTDLPKETSVGGQLLVSDTTYDAFGRSIRDQYGPSGKRLYTMSEFDEQTGRLTRVVNDRETAPQRIDDTRYAYDPAGNITQLTTTDGQDGAAVTDTQCFTTDALQRISNAWTTTDGCAAKPDSEARPQIGGPNAYWHSYTYDAVGSRATETRHDAGGDSGKDIKRTYTYPEKGKPQPRALASVTTKVGGKDIATGPDTFTYDPAGNTTRRRVADKDQQLSWDAEGHLTRVVEGNKTTSFSYDTDGNRIIRRDAEGTTLYLPGGNELLLKPDGKTKVGTRYYSHGDKTVAVRSEGKLTYLLSDHHGTATTAVDATSQMVTTRRTDIFGAPRGEQPASWPGERGFVGGTKDKATGLTHLGAREYDPALARFISVDPIMDLSDPQQLHGYSYGNNNPLIHSDPSGKLFGGWGSIIGLLPGMGAIGAVMDAIDEMEEVITRPSSSWSRGYKSTYSGGSGYSSRSSYHGGGSMGIRPCANSQCGTPKMRPKPLPHISGPGGGQLNFLKEVAITGCSWLIPVVCDAYDVKRSYDEGDTAGVWIGVFAAIIPGGDLLKAGKQAKRLEKAAESGEDAGKAAKKSERSEGSHKSATVPRDMMDPKSMQGASIDEVMDLTKGDGWMRQDAPFATGGGIMLKKGNPTIILEYGDPVKSRDLLHKGPYLKYQMGKKPVRIPLEGNPSLGG
ncbi:RHS repeat domain-containing protein [Streptomyces sp. NPDC001678]|uniref:RHS repeat domain-containing protein n=1 Tax=Streptomyces sp. NPDC001678 TaxID=3364599 RepID=UPI00369772BE